jgi:hypothetical protein
MTCLSCHQMHQAADDPRPAREWANDMLKPGMEGNRACLQCHHQFEDRQRLARHTHHKPESTGSTCYNCHMPHTSYGLLSAIRSHTVDSPTVQASLSTGRPNACNQCHLDRTLSWAADNLQTWYATPRPELSQDERTIAASVLWSLKGDAGQRALMAWSFGWRSAREASGDTWMPVYLAGLLDDSYPAVRLIAARSLRTYPAYQGFQYDPTGRPEERSSRIGQALDIWAQEYGATRGAPRSEEVLIGPEDIRRGEIARLVGQRDDRPMVLTE